MTRADMLYFHTPSRADIEISARGHHFCPRAEGPRAEMMPEGGNFYVCPRLGGVEITFLLISTDLGLIYLHFPMNKMTHRFIHDVMQTKHKSR